MREAAERTDLGRVCCWVWEELEEADLGVAGWAAHIRLAEALRTVAEDRGPVEAVALVGLAGVTARMGGSVT